MESRMNYPAPCQCFGGCMGREGWKVGGEDWCMAIIWRQFLSWLFGNGSDRKSITTHQRLNDSTTAYSPPSSARVVTSPTGSYRETIRPAILPSSIVYLDCLPRLSIMAIVTDASSARQMLVSRHFQASTDLERQCDINKLKDDSKHKSQC